MRTSRRHARLAAALLVALAAPALAEAAEVGRAAPDFTLTDLDGKVHRLSDHRGKVVVLEWFNPGCPYVVNAHTKGSLVDAAARAGKEGVVWLAVNSAAPGKQGHGAEVNREAARRWSMAYPILLDERGAAGRAYGATNTPHLFVIGRDGTLAYRGAVDNSPDGERGSPKGGVLVEYVTAALEDLKAARPLRTAETKAYGCSVKFAN
jgi:peroxiredoxin